MYYRSTSRSRQKGREEESPRKKKLRQQVLKLKAKVRSLEQRNRRLQKKIKNQKNIEPAGKKQKEHETLYQLACKFFPQSFARIIFAQIDAQNKSKRGRRYSTEFKQFALCLYFFSPQNYRMLKKEIALPSIRTLQLFTQTWQIKPGINVKIFDILAIKLYSLPLLERHCILCIDEMSLKAHLFYNVSQDQIIGFEDTGNEKLPLPAKSALVIMARSITSN